LPSLSWLLVPFHTAISQHRKPSCALFDSYHVLQQLLMYFHSCRCRAAC
jgi:hypothetical protein